MSDQDMNLTVERVLLETIKTDPKNARSHNQRNYEAIQDSLQQFGQRKPIVVGYDNVIQAGEGTYCAAIALGWKYIDIVRSPLTGKESAAYSIADNRTAELADWDMTVLVDALRDAEEPIPGFDTEDIAGFDDILTSKPDRRGTLRKLRDEKIKAVFVVAARLQGA